MALNPNDLANFDLLSNLQGNILKGHGREHTTHIFVHFDASKIMQAKKWIRSFADNTLTSAQKQLKQREVFKRTGIPGGIFASFFISASGYTALGLVQPPDASFKAGMKAPATKALLKDPDKTTWDHGYNTDIHAMVLLANDDSDEMGG